MLIIKSLADIGTARFPPHLAAAATKHFQIILDAYQSYNPDDDGHLVVVTPSDSDASLGLQLGRKWRESLFEGVDRDGEHGCFVVVILSNNQHAVSILIPDEPWLDVPIRTRLRREMTTNGHLAPLPTR